MTRMIAAAVMVSVIALWAIGCQKSTSTAPSPTPGATPPVVSLAIEGPSRIAPGETAQFRAIATLSDRTTQDYTRKVTWWAGSPDVLTVTRDTGQATGVAPGDTRVFVSTPACSAGCNASMMVTVLPPNTFRLTGKVLESGLGVQDALVTVLSGTGGGTSTKTGYDGSYRLYGVAGAVQIRVSKAGYADMLKAFTVTQNDFLDFPEAHQIAPIHSMGGTYVLTLQADPGCSTEPVGGWPPLPAEFRQPRNYTAQVAQDGPSLSVTLASPQFAAPSNQFSGRIEPQTIEFQLGGAYFYGPDDGVTEHVSSTVALSWNGQVHAALSGSTVIGRLDGDVQAYDFSRPWVSQLIGACRASNHQFAMRVSTGQFR